MTKIENVKDAILTAIQMEKDGYAFYTKAADQTNSDMGRSIFESLAADEQRHLDVFQKMFEDKAGQSEWNDLINSSKKYETVNIFPKDLKETSVNTNVDELDALRIAMESEQTAIDYYSKILQATNDPNIKKVIDIIIDQEKKHYLILEGEFTHLSSTGYWYDLDYLGG